MATRDDIPPSFWPVYDALTAQQKTDWLADIDSKATSSAALRGLVPILRGWGDDADMAIAVWDGWTQAQKNAALKTVIERFGAMVDRMADLLVSLNGKL